MAEYCKQKISTINENVRFKNFLQNSLSSIKNGSLTVVLQDRQAIQVNICEKYTDGDCLCESSYFKWRNCNG